MIDVQAEIQKRADPKYKEFNTKLVPGIKNSYGVRVPQLREITKEILKDDWECFLESESKCFEEIMLHGLVIANAKTDIEKRMFYIKKFVPTIDNWCVCDIFCGKWKLNKQEKSIIWNYCNEQLDSDEEFRMRFATVMIMANFMDDQHIDEILELMSIKYHPGYYYRMGAAWCISNCYIKYPEKTEPYIISGKFDPDIMNRSVQKICDSYRVGEEEKKKLRSVKKEILNRSPRSS
ncbi:MAG: DNA alkylation repair protein [Candidatus Methanogranum gryphiswaldense]|nr:MAG: DNA alkylation repair protein [Candidatus Methanogranum sp. U3.2.1]